LQRLQQKQTKIFLKQGRPSRSNESESGQTAFCSYTRAEIKRERERFSSPQETVGRNRRHCRINHDMFDKCKKQISAYHSDSSARGQRDNVNTQGYRRLDAVDIYNKDYCEYLVRQKLEGKQMRIKDSMSMFYSRVETLIDPMDQDYNQIAHEFGYKCALVRDERQRHLLMEIFLPTLKVNTEKKIRKMNNFHRRHKFHSH